MVDPFVRTVPGGKYDGRVSPQVVSARFCRFLQLGSPWLTARNDPAPLPKPGNGRGAGEGDYFFANQVSCRR
jgi:hypothetical protein